MRLVPSVLAVALGAAAGVPARAEPRALTLPEALAYAGLHQPSLVAARARLEAARREAEIPRGLWFPRVGATVQALAGTANNSTASTFSTSAVDLPRIGGTRAAPPVAWDPHASTLAGVGLRQELFDFGRIGALEEVYDAAAQVESARAEVQALDVALLVEESYLGVHAARAVLQAALGAEERARASTASRRRPACTAACAARSS